MKIYEKLLAIQTQISVSKDKFNDFADFKYRSCEDILQSLKPYLKEQNCIVLLNDELTSIGDKIFIKAVAKLIDVESGDLVLSDAYAQIPPKPKAKMDESQMTGSTSSYARKYALGGLFALDDGNDSDSNNKGENVKSEKLITKAQIDELKKYGFTDERLEKMTKYYKKDKLQDVTYKEAAETLAKQRKVVNNG